MNKTKRTSTRRPASPSKRSQQMSLGGILLTLLVALITWWSGLGRTPADAPVAATATPLVEAANAQPTALPTATGPASGKTATPESAIKVVSVAQPDTPTPKPTVAKQKTPRPTKAATATPLPTKTRPPPTAKPPTPTPKPQRAVGVSGLPAVRFDQLPREAKRTIDLIDRGGPFPFYQDGTVFQNRERLLPRKSRNYYHEYTVITPGEDDRGARRIIAGDGGELFYTDDHYESFREVVR